MTGGVGLIRARAAETLIANAINSHKAETSLPFLLSPFTGRAPAPAQRLEESEQRAPLATRVRIDPRPHQTPREQSEYPPPPHPPTPVVNSGHPRYNTHVLVRWPTPALAPSRTERTLSTFTHLLYCPEVGLLFLRRAVLVGFFPVLKVVARTLSRRTGQLLPGWSSKPTSSSVLLFFKGYIPPPPPPPPPQLLLHQFLVPVP